MSLPPPRRKFGETALMTPANALTASRLVLAGIFIWLVVSRGPSWWTTLAGFIAASSDYFDGIVARRQGPTTSGAFLDPLADKIVVLSSLFTLVAVHRLALIPVLVITARELWMTWYRSRASRQGVSIPARTLPKFKTLAQDFAICFLVFPPTVHLHWLQLATMWLAVTLTLVTGLQYYLDGRKALVQ